MPHSEGAGLLITQHCSVNVHPLVDDAVLGPHFPGHFSREHGSLEFLRRVDDACDSLLAANLDAVHEELFFTLLQNGRRRSLERGFL